jgi:hypothetical protein
MGFFGFGKKKKEEETVNKAEFGSRRIVAGAKTLHETGKVAGESEEEEIKKLRERIKIGLASPEIKSVREQEKLEFEGQRIRAGLASHAEQDKMLAKLDKDLEKLDSYLDEPNVANDQEATNLIHKEIHEKETLIEEIHRSRLPPISNKEMNELGIEKDEKGNIILYHITYKKFLPNILGKGLLPTRDTGNRTWSVQGESYKKNKIYLAPYSEVDKIKSGILSGKKDEEAVVLEVHVPEGQLYPDEDSHKPDWILSLKSFFKTCACRGKIPPENLKVVG